MRDIYRFPVTDKEIDDWLDSELTRYLGQKVYGDLRPLIITEIRQRLSLKRNTNEVMEKEVG